MSEAPKGVPLYRRPVNAEVEEDLDLRPPLPSLEEMMADGGRLLIIHTLRSLPYDEYLQTTWWHNRREQAKREANYMCAVCMSNRRLHVHHIRYGNLGCEPAEDLRVLCDLHHEMKEETLAIVARHEGMKRFQQ